jgi:hypothetical protein
VERKAVTDIAAARLLAQADPSLSDCDRMVLNVIAGWPHIHDLDECLRAGDVTLDGLCGTVRLPRPYVFAAVARLEDAGYLPMGAIR